MRQVGTVDEGTLDLLTATPAARQFAEKRRAQAARRGAVKDARA
jgi:hypothetical protein